MESNIIKILLLTILTSWAWSPGPFYPEPEPEVQIKQQVLSLLAKHQDTTLLTLMAIKKWKAFENRYVVFACFAQNSMLLHKYNKDYRASQNGKFVIKRNCEIDRTYNPNDWIAKSTYLMVFDLDSSGKIHKKYLRKEAINNWDATPDPIPTTPEINIETGEPVERELNPWPWSGFPEKDSNGDFISGDGFSFESLDLAPYKLNGNSSAIGVRIAATSNGAGSAYTTTHALVLFQPEGDSLRPVFAHCVGYDGSARAPENGFENASEYGDSYSLILGPLPKTYSKEMYRKIQLKSKTQKTLRFSYDPIQKFYLKE